MTYEGVLELFLKTDLKMQETDRQLKQMARETDQQLKQIARETDRRMRETDRKISALGSRIGEIVENMIGGNIVDQFRALGYEVVAYSRNLIFQNPISGESGEIDLILHDGDVVILIEAKVKPTTSDVKDHVDRLEKYRRHVDRHGPVASPRFVGAIAGAVVDANVTEFAQKQGMYVIVQSGYAVEIIPSPEGFAAKKW